MLELGKKAAFIGLKEKKSNRKNEKAN